MIRKDGNLYVEKRLSSREVSEPEAVARLRSEAALLVHLAGTGITPRLIDHGQDERGPWIRTERLAMPTVAERLVVEHVITSEWIEAATLASVRALIALHDACDAQGQRLDIVHADLSPGNLAIDDEGSNVVILDFDLAWWRESPPRDDGAFRGTIAYVAPEIARGERPTAKSDVFSLGALLLHAATGQSPRAIDTMPSFAALLVAAAETPLVAPAHLAERGRGHAAILRMIAHDPSDRPSPAELLLDA